VLGGRSSALAALCGAVALAAALAAALLPADEERARFTWPPVNLTAQAPAQGWYAPLPLLNRVPRSLEVLLPCGLSPPSIRRSPTVLSTTRARDDDTGLHIVQRERAMHVSLGSTRIVAPWPRACPLVVAARDGRLDVGGRVERVDSTALDDMPIVTGLFSNLDLATGNPPRVEIETRPYGTMQTALQIILVVVAAVLAASTILVLVAGRAHGSRRRAFSRELRSLWRTRGPPDAVVVVVVLVWWLVAPPLYDDGWFQALHRAADDIGGFAYYFKTWSVNISVGYWADLLRQPFTSSTNFPFARLPALAAILLAWPLCRWCAARVVPHPSEAPVRWTLAATFLVGVVAWEMTLRHEPFVFLLALTALAAAIAFARSPDPAALAVAGLAVALSVNAHPAGIVALAPLVACLPGLVRQLRGGARRIVLAAGYAAAFAAVAIALFTLDADLGARLGDGAVTREEETLGYSFWQEYLRYDQFDEEGGGPVIRHLSLVLLLLCVAGLLTRGRAALCAHAAIPARSVAVGLLLLSFVPSKWPWHFGALAAMGAVAAAAELSHLSRTTFAGGRVVSVLNKVVGLAIVAAAAAWVWSENGSWNRFDLQELTWGDVFNPWTQLAMLAAIAIVAALFVRPRKLGAAAVDRFLGQLLVWTVPVFSFAALGLTIGAFALDGVRAPWSPLRQNVEALAGDPGCGLADRLGGAELGRELSRSDTATLVSPPLVPYLPCVRQPAIVDGVVETPRLLVLDRTLWPLDQPTSPFQSFVDLYGARRVATGPRGTQILRVTPEIPGYARIDADVADSP
jgi:arabinosyltransferase B